MNRSSPESAKNLESRLELWVDQEIILIPDPFLKIVSHLVRVTKTSEKLKYEVSATKP